VSFLLITYFIVDKARCVMKKSEIEHIQRCRFLESGEKIKSQVETIVRSINLKYPDLAEKIEISQSDTFQSAKSSGDEVLTKYLRIFLNQKLLA
jgi:hypothetical protein